MAVSACASLGAVSQARCLVSCDQPQFSEHHKQLAAQLLITAATLERGYQAFRESGNLQVFQPQVNEIGKLHRQWLSDLKNFINSLRVQGREPKTLESVNEAFGRLAERIKKLAG